MHALDQTTQIYQILALPFIQMVIFFFFLVNSSKSTRDCCEKWKY